MVLIWLKEMEDAILLVMKTIMRTAAQPCFSILTGYGPWSEEEKLYLGVGWGGQIVQWRWHFNAPLSWVGWFCGRHRTGLQSSVVQEKLSDSQTRTKHLHTAGTTNQYELHFKCFKFTFQNNYFGMLFKKEKKKPQSRIFTELKHVEEVLLLLSQATSVRT